ncbi:MAG: LamG-like jellyroll fold domain-containing protein, partial [Rhodothermales bacterium]|nr:LamG-like jellyroll fold domain-containing protein [Rhodothermales bacterium]
MRHFAFAFLLLTPLVVKPGLAQQAVRFGVAGAYLEVADAPSLSTSEFTIEFWLRVRELGDPAGAGGEQTVFDKRSDTSGYNFRLAGEEFPVQLFAIVENRDVGTVIDRNVWTHVAVTQSADSLKIYKNAVLAAADTNRYSAQSTSPLRIGSLGWPGLSYELRGDMDEIRMWDHARPADSISANVHNKLTGSESGLVAYWDFEGAAIDVFPDLSPNGNDAHPWGIITLIPSDAPVGFVPLPAPTGLRALGTTNSIELSWRWGGDEVAEYSIYRSGSPDFLADESNRIASISGDDSTFVDMNVVPGHDYYYRLRCVDQDEKQSAAGVAALGRVFVEVNYVTGVYYYPQFGPADTAGTWESVYVRDLLDTRQPPALGHYSGRDPSVVAQHMEWMDSYGIDFIVTDWWEEGSWKDVTLREYLLPTLEESGVRFALQYPVWNHWGDEGLMIDATVIQRMVSDFQYMAETYFDHPSVLTVDDRPVV